jgi:putative hydrolase of the HAD superfamily
MTITTIFFDLDDTLYSAKTGLWSNVRERISLYMREQLMIPAEEISAMRQKYLEQYGTTLLGLHHHYSLDVGEFLDFVHDLPLRDYIQPAPELRTIIEAIPARKFIFSNADVKHVQRVLKVLELEDCFDGVLDLLQMWPNCKPMPVSFEMALKLAGNPAPEQCAMIDDLPRNAGAAREQGMFSILYGIHAATHPTEANATLTDWSDLPALLKSVK